MKKLFVIMAALLLTCSTFAQDKEVKGLQFGVHYRTEFVNFVHQQQSANLSLGYRINRGNYVGLQSGYVFKGSTWIDADPGEYAYRGIPLRAEYTHYFGLGQTKRHSIYAGAEAGGIFANYYKGFQHSELYPPAGRNNNQLCGLRLVGRSDFLVFVESFARQKVVQVGKAVGGDSLHHGRVVAVH